VGKGRERRRWASARLHARTCRSVWTSYARACRLLTRRAANPATAATRPQLRDVVDFAGSRGHVRRQQHGPVAGDGVRACPIDGVGDGETDARAPDGNACAREREQGVVRVAPVGGVRVVMVRGRRDDSVVAGGDAAGREQREAGERVGGRQGKLGEDAEAAVRRADDDDAVVEESLRAPTPGKGGRRGRGCEVGPDG